MDLIAFRLEWSNKLLTFILPGIGIIIPKVISSRRWNWNSGKVNNGFIGMLMDFLLGCIISGYRLVTRLVLERW